MKKQTIFLLLLVISSSNADEDKPNNSEKPALMERLVQSLPQIPNVIKGQMEGKPEELKKMISNMLGDGLLSQLVVNPMSVAENMGVPLNDLGINNTVLEKSIGKDKDGDKNAGFNIFSAFTSPAPSTKKIMYVDGVPIENFDEFIRKHQLESSGFTTSVPPTTTTPFTPEKVAEVVLERLKSRETPILAEPPRSTVDISRTLDMNMIDPKRVAEVNQLLRRAPQKFDMPTGPMDIGPPGFVQSLDPSIDEVVTNLRTKGTYGLTVDDVKRLQNILQTYEETLQTKELLAKRKQLQVLQTELSEQRKRIEVQKRMEEELRKKEKELEEEKQKMERQLTEQLHNWHSSFGPYPRGPELPKELQLEPMGSPPGTHITTTTEGTTTEEETSALPSSHERKLAEEREEIVERQMSSSASPIRISSALRHHIRYSPTTVPVNTDSEMIPPSMSVQRDEEDLESHCECEQVSLDKMNGKWLIALASKNVVNIMEEHTANLVQKESASLTCSRFDIVAGRKSVAAQDARLIWQFKTSTSEKIMRLRGNALTTDHVNTRVQMTDFDGENFSFPFCVLRSGGVRAYDYILVTNSKEDCKDVALLVRNPQEFFDNPDKKLQKYLKAKIAKKEMNPLDVVNFGDC
ncbi:unnamed protein product [Caenorhabditis bovis]|uniref:Uncharacterized protein n=1 Tax=Caenorhabditis bovis TaxID=2654633 RepID=A0A8S1EJ24_9PELO|nr:unnamed protein product [Caenorhabditis bovis]